MRKLGKMRNRILPLCIASFLVFGGFVGFLNFGSENAQAPPTFVSGIVYDGSGGPWTIAGSPYIVIGTVTVPAGQTLTIDPGVEVKFDGYHSISVSGNLNAVGTQANRITMTSNNSIPSPGDWSRIRTFSQGRVDVRYADIEYASYGVWLDSPNNIIMSSRIISSYNGGISIWFSSNNSIMNNNISLSGGIGIYVRNAMNNYLSNNSFINDGIFIEGDTLPHYNTHNIPDNNTINGKPIYYYKNCSNIDIDGTPIGELILANCTNVNVKNSQIIYSDVGIEVAYSKNINLSKLNVSSNYLYGIYFFESSNTTIKNTNVSLNEINSIYVRSSANTNIMNNNISLNNASGISCGYSSNNTIINNNFTLNNGIGIAIWQSSNDSVSQNRISSNEGDGIYISDSVNTTLSYNDVTLNDGDAIVLSGASSSTVIRNNITHNNGKGIFVGSSYNEISYNYIAKNFYPIYIDFGGKNVITNNYMVSNSNAIRIGFSSSNRIYHNDIINNGMQAWDDTGNSYWNDTYPSGGNYWSDWSPTCEDMYNGSSTPQMTGSPDGICDNAYYIVSNNKDYYPLKNPVDQPSPMIVKTYPVDGFFDISLYSAVTIIFNKPIDTSTFSYTISPDPGNWNWTWTMGNTIVMGTHAPYNGSTAYTFAVTSAYDLSGNPLVEGPVPNPWNWTTGLAIVETSPVNDMMHVPLNEPIIITFSGPVDNTTIPSQFWMISPDPGGSWTKTWILGNTVVILDHSNLFEECKSYWFDVTIFYLVPGPVPEPWQWTTVCLNSGNITGTVNDVNIYPIEGATITLTDSIGTLVDTATTDSNGNYLFIDVEPAADEYSVTAEKSHYESRTRDNIDVIVGSTTLVDFSLNTNAIIKGRTFDENGVLMESVTIALLDDDENVLKTTTTDSDGIFKFTKIGYGEYTVYASKSGYNTTTTDSFIVDKDNLDIPMINIMLTRAYDSTPPTFINLEPPDASITNNNKPTIGANFNDTSGIDVYSVVLKVDNVDVTSSATVTTSGIIYTPVSALEDGTHEIYLEVSDTKGNLATTSWSFTVDTLTITPPGDFLGEYWWILLIFIIVIVDIILFIILRRKKVSEGEVKQTDQPMEKEGDEE